MSGHKPKNAKRKKFCFFFVKVLFIKIIILILKIIKNKGNESNSKNND